MLLVLCEFIEYMLTFIVLHLEVRQAVGGVLDTLLQRDILLLELLVVEFDILQLGSEVLVEGVELVALVIELEELGLLVLVEFAHVLVVLDLGNERRLLLPAHVELVLDLPQQTEGAFVLLLLDLEFGGHDALNAIQPIAYVLLVELPLELLQLLQLLLE